MDEPADRSRPAVSLRLAAAIVVAAWALSAAPALIACPVKKAAQARAWAVARTMARDGDWAVPSYQGEPRLKKPPLQSWVQAAAMEVTGDTSVRVAGFASWLVGALFALGPLLLGAALARPTAGLLGSLMLATSRAAESYGASPEHDVPFAAFVVLALAFLARAVSARGRPRDAWFAGLASGAALLVKGPFSLAFVLGTAVVVAIGRRRRPTPRPVPWGPLLVGTFLPALLWLAVVGMRLGSVSAVFDEMRRQALGEGGAHVKSGVLGVLYFAGVVPALALPWVIVALGALGGALLLARRGTQSGAPAANESSPSIAFAATAFLVGFATLTIVPAKQEHYALPILPAAFLCLGAALERGLAGLRGHAARAAPFVVAAAGIAFGLSRVASAARTVESVPPPWPFVAAGAVVFAAVSLAPKARARRALLLAFVAAATVAGWGAHADAVRALRTDDYRAAVAASFPRGEGFDDREVIGLAAGEGEAFDALAVWIDRPVRRETQADAVADRIARGDRFLLLVPGGDDEGEALAERGLLPPPVVLAPEKAKTERDRVRLHVIGK